MGRDDEGEGKFPLAGPEPHKESSERRSKLSILKDILKTIQSKGGKARPTHILYGANLSHDRLTRYLEQLEKEKFVKRSLAEEGGSYYEITKRGVEFLSGYNKMKDFFDAFGMSL
jgi:predicted transcriptional regulator